MNCQDTQPLLNALLDGELAPAQRATADAHVKTCPSCTAALRELEGVRDAIREAAPYYQAPPGLRDQVRFALRGAGYVDRPARRTDWRVWGAAAAAVVFAVTGSAVFLERSHSERQLVAEEILSAHQRALMGHEIDVISTDRHTVKPWFNGKLPFSPPVADLAAEGFPLQGGRLDYAGSQPLAVLVYARKLHRIDVFVWPSGGAAPTNFDRNGYHELSWTKDNFVFVAISDLNGEELSQFRRLMLDR